MASTMHAVLIATVVLAAASTGTPGPATSVPDETVDPMRLVFLVAPGGGKALKVPGLLDRHRHAEQRALAAGRQPGVRLRGLG